jgi:chromosome segregation ATPase
LKKKVAKDAPAIKQQQQHVDIAAEEIRQAKLEEEAMDRQIEALQATLESMRVEEKSMEGDLFRIKVSYLLVADFKNQFDQAETALQNERKHLSHFDGQLKEFEKQRKLKKDEIQEAELQCNRLNLEMEQFDKEKKELQTRVKEYMDKHPWIRDQQQ